MSWFWCQHAVPTDEQNHSIRMEKSNERQEITIGATPGCTEYSSICEQKSWALINVSVTKSDFTRCSRVASPPSRGVGLHPTQDTAGATVRSPVRHRFLLNLTRGKVVESCTTPISTSFCIAFQQCFPFKGVRARIPIAIIMSQENDIGRKPYPVVWWPMFSSKQKNL